MSAPVLLTRQDVVDELADWVRRVRDRDWFANNPRNEALLALAEAPTLDAYAAATDRPSLLLCHGCSRMVAAVVRVGEAPEAASDDAPHNAQVCADCLDQACALLRGAR